MATEAGHIQISEFSRDVIPSINWMMEDLFCQYGVSIPYFMLDYDFPDYSQRPDWVSGYSFNLDWGAWGYWLPWFNELLGLLWDEAHLPRLTLPDLSLPSVTMFNDYTEILYDNMQRHYVYSQSGTFIKDEVIEGETSGITGWYKWIDGDGYIHVANKQDASGEPVADFEEEKIVGADSGAYAWTYVITEQTFSVIAPVEAHIVAGYAIVDSAPNEWELAWEEYLSNPSYEARTFDIEAAIGWTGGAIPGKLYRVSLFKHCMYVDTSAAISGFTTATLRMNLIFHVTYDVDVTLRVYSYDYGDVVDGDDWSGGDLVGTYSLPADEEDGWKEVDIDVGAINVGGITKFKITSSNVETVSSAPVHSLFSWFNKSTMKLILKH